MYRINRVCEETVSPHVGRSVCLVMKDGKHMYGTLSQCRDGKVYLNGCFEGPRLCSVKSKQQLVNSGKKKLLHQRKLNLQPTVDMDMEDTVGVTVMEQELIWLW
ncbi:hypothetical protein MT997_04960 [Paenibacillus sp. OVF10]|nr:hypothetical protein MT997_04960 [Paenibacillus sp. OVF10]